jgi:hypothetical protein
MVKLRRDKETVSLVCDGLKADWLNSWESEKVRWRFYISFSLFFTSALQKAAVFPTV